MAFAEFYRLRIEPTLRPGAVVTHVKFRGLDGFSSVITIEDALDHDVLLADHLDGEHLGNDHGAPLRVVSPAQYGYISTKHLCRIDVHTAAPIGGPRSFVLDVLLHSHPRARVWHEERHGTLPGPVVRPFYRAVAKVSSSARQPAAEPFAMGRGSCWPVAERIRLADLLGGLSMVADLGFGLPPETALRTSLVATALGRRLQLPSRRRARLLLYRVCSMHVGCLAVAHESAVRVQGTISR